MAKIIRKIVWKVTKKTLIFAGKIATLYLIRKAWLSIKKDLQKKINAQGKSKKSKAGKSSTKKKIKKKNKVRKP